MALATRSHIGWQTFAIFCILSIVCCFPIWTVKIPPLTDYPNHLARLYIIAHQKHPILSTYYIVHWHVIPDLAADIIVPIFEHFFSVYTAGRLFLVVTILLITSGTYAVQHALYQELTGPALCFVFIYNAIFLFGFLNYLFSIGVALWATAGWIALRNHWWLSRAAFSGGAMLLLFFCHLAGVGLYALAALCYEVSRLRMATFDLARIGRDTAAAAPFLFAAPLLIITGTSDQMMDVHWLALSQKWIGLYFIARGTHLAIDAISCLMIILLLFYLSYHGYLKIPRLAWVFIVVASITYLVVPYQIHNLYFVDVRLPIAFLFVFIAIVRWRVNWPIASLIFNGLVCAVVLFRTVGVVQAWQVYGELASDYEKSFLQISRGSRILVTLDEAASWQGSGNRVTIGMDKWAILQFPTLAAIERSCLVPLFADPGQQVLAFRAPYHPTRIQQPLSALQVGGELDAPSDNAPFRIRDWRRQYDYLYIQYAPPGTDPNLSDLRLIYQGRSFQLYKIIASN